MVTTTLDAAVERAFWSGDATYATAAAGTGGTQLDNASSYVVGQQTGFTLYEALMSFAIPAMTAINSGTLRLRLSSDFSTTNFVCHVYAVTWAASPPTFAAGDWRTPAEISGLTLIATLDTNGIGASGSYKSFVEVGTGLRDAIFAAAGGTLQLVIASSRFEAGTQPSGNEYVFFSMAAGDGNPAKLDLDYDSPPIAAGAATLPSLTAAGIGNAPPTATGSPRLAHLRAAGIGVQHPKATGAAALPNLTDSGVAHVNVGEQVAGDYVLEVDWDGDGDFGEAIEDITSYATDVQTVTGRDYASNLTGKASAGKLVAQLHNADSRFNPFNTGSPLTGLMLPGRKVRLRTAASVPLDPVILAKDRFNRADASTLGTAETGGSWTGGSSGGLEVANHRAVAHESAVNSLDYSTVDVGVADYYAQARFVQGLATGSAATLSLVVRLEDASNLVRATIDPAAATLALVERDGAANSTLFSMAVELRDGMYIGLRALGDTVTLYLDGVAVAARVVAATGTKAGLRQELWESPAVRPEFDDFYVYAGIVADGEETDGVIWTGTLAELKPNVAGMAKTATLTAEGALAGLAAAPVLSPVSEGAGTGYLVGNILGQAGYLNPPGPIEPGELTTGVYAPSDGDGLSLARQLEAAELGFIFETPAGSIGYRSRQRRFLDQTSKATFSDDSGNAGLRMGSIDESDWNKEVYNRATASPSPYSIGAGAVLWTDPGPYTLASGESADLLASYSSKVQTWTGHSRDVTEPGGDPVFEEIATQTFASTASPGVTVPAVSIGDLLIVIIAGQSFSIATPAAPAGWTKYGNLGTASIYAKPIASGAGSGTVTFTAPAASTWAVQVIRVSSWYEALTDGFQTVEGASSDGRVPITPSWGAAPTMFIGVLAWLSNGTASNTSYPTGYSGGTHVENLTSTATHIATAHREASVATELHDGFVFNPAVQSSYRSHMIAIRGATETAPTSVAGGAPSGSSGAFTISYDAGVGGAVQYHRNIAVSGVPIVQGDVATVVRNDTASQDKYGLRPFAAPPALFASVADATAWCDLVNTRNGEPAPILEISFVANRDASHMAAACNRRVGDRITVEADGNTGLGINEDFFIESIHHHLSRGRTLHEVTWEVSPSSVTDP